MVSDVLGKRVLLLFATFSNFQFCKFLSELEKMYYALHGSNDHFEVIYISTDRCRPKTSLRKCIRKMPWFVYSVHRDFASSLAGLLFNFDEDSAYHHQLPAIAAFGPSGNLVGKECNLAFKEELGTKFPFVSSFNKEEALREIRSIFGWDLEFLFRGISLNKL